MNSNFFKESFYNFKLTTNDNRLLIYNSKTGAICSVNDDKRKDVIQILENPNSDCNKELFDSLFNQGYIVNDSVNELEAIKEAYDKYRNLKNKISLIMLPAEACNFSCPYCFTYEHRNMYMEDWVYESAYKYIEKKTIENDSEGETTYLGIAWFGGEPLLASNKIIEFMKKLNLLKSKYNMVINSGVVSNGYLLTHNLFKELVDLGVRSYDITIDGDRESHNLTRKLKTGQDTFDEIYNNLKSISKSIPLDIKFNFTIRINFLKNTVNKMEQFIETLSADFSSDKRFNLFFKPIYNIKTSRGDVDNISSNICSHDDSFESQRKLSYLTMDKEMCDYDSFKIFDPLPKPTFTWCDTVQPFTHIVGADGSIFSCDTLMVDKEQRAGILTKEGDIVLNENGDRWKRSIFAEKTPIIEECTKCKLLPVCMGGCKRAWIDNKRKACYWSEDKIYSTMELYVNKRIKKNA